MKALGRLARTVIGLAVVIAGSIVTAQPALAAAQPVIVSPGPGGTLPVGSTGPLVIDFPAQGSYLVDVSCGASAYYWYDGGPKVYSGRQNIAISPLETSYTDLAGAACRVSIRGGNPYATVSSDFTLTAPPLEVSRLKASNHTFFPLVKDGYRDGTKFAFSVNRFFAATLTIKDSRGETVLTDDDNGEVDGPGDYTWNWNGRTTHGKPVLPGRYRATVEVIISDGSTKTVATSVRVVTKRVTRTKKITRPGSSELPSTSGDCSANDNFSDNSVMLSCSGGAYAAATYNFAIPSDAANIRWGVKASRTEDDLARGSIVRRGSRIGKTKFVVRVQVTGSRAVKIASVWVFYRGTFQI